jgi:hypothetical protein
LYLSVFPEDYLIEKRTLVWMWVAEGFVEKRQVMSSFEIGEGYFNELANRSMIRIVEQDKDWCDMVCGSQVHDMVLDLLCSISSEENFVTILGKNNEFGGRVRRLALQNDATVKAHMNMQQVRSFISWWWDIGNGISLLSFKLVRVLALHTTSYSSCNVRDLQLTTTLSRFLLHSASPPSHFLHLPPWVLSAETDGSGPVWLRSSVDPSRSGTYYTGTLGASSDGSWVGSTSVESMLLLVD